MFVILLFSVLLHLYLCTISVYICIFLPVFVTICMLWWLARIACDVAAAPSLYRQMRHITWYCPRRTNSAQRYLHQKNETISMLGLFDWIHDQERSWKLAVETSWNWKTNCMPLIEDRGQTDRVTILANPNLNPWPWPMTLTFNPRWA